MTRLLALLALIAATCSALHVSHGVTAARTCRPRPTAAMLAKKPAAKKEVMVLLSDDIKGVGKKGEIVSVKPAYAQNFITPNGLGEVATPQLLKQLEQDKAEAAAAAAAAKEAAVELAARLKEMFDKEGAVIKKKAGPSGEIFGKVTSSHLAEIIKARSGAEVNKKDISVPTIKGLGSAVAKVTLHKEVPPVTVQLKVIAE